MKGLSLVVFLVTVSLGLAVFAFSLKKTSTFQSPKSSPQQTQKPRDSNLEKLQIGNTIVWVKIAQTYQQKKQGLSGVESMAEDEGILFVYDEPDSYNFWMKDMNFPLDFIWIREGEVVDLSENVPVFDQNGNFTRVQPNQPANQILEVNSGFIEKNKIEVGNRVKLEEY